MVCSSGPVAVVLVRATAPLFIPSCSHSPCGRCSGGLGPGRLARYGSVRPSCAAKLVLIRVTSHGIAPAGSTKRHGLSEARRDRGGRHDRCNHRYAASSALPTIVSPREHRSPTAG